MNYGNKEKLNYLMSPTLDCPYREGGAGFRYVLLSTPRCGSNLVSDMLISTQLAGYPLEYLNGRYMYAWDRMRPESAAVGKKTIAEYLAMLEKYRTTRNGIFGLKVHYAHLEKVWCNNPSAGHRWLDTLDRVVLLSRRDKIAQAVSLYKAGKTQIWSSLDYKFMSEDDPRRKINPQYSFAGIAAALEYCLKHEAGWRKILKARKIGFIELVYEDVVENFQSYSNRLLDYLGVEEGCKLTSPRTKKQGEGNQYMADRFVSELGISANKFDVGL